MSLLTDIIFIKALQADKELTARLPGGKVYNNYAFPDIDLDNVPLPYLCVNFDQGQNTSTTKDNGYEGVSDTVNISIRVVGRHRKEQAELAVMVRKAIREYFTAHSGDDSDPDFALIPYCMEFSWGEAGYDPQKPCCVQMLNYQCDTEPD